MNTARRILKNFLSLTFADIFVKFLGFITIIYLARIFTPQTFGILNFALSIINYFAYITDPGITTFGAKNISQHPDKIKNWINNIFITRIYLSLLAFLSLLAIILMSGETLQVKLVIVLYGLTIFPLAISPTWIYHGTQKMEYAATYTIIQGISYTTLIFLFIKGPDDILCVPVILTTAYMAGNVFLYVPIIRFCKDKLENIDYHSVINLVKTSLPIGISAFLVYGINWNLSTTLLGLFSNHSEVGYFSVAFKIPLAIIGSASALGTVLFPVLSYYRINSPENNMKLVYISQKLILILGIPLIAGCALLSEELISTVFGSKYLFSTLPFKILIPGAVLCSLNLIYYIYMIAIDKQKENMNISIVRTLLLGVFSLIFIPANGANGASIAYLVSEFLTLIIYITSTSIEIKPQLIRISFKPLIASIIMGILLFFSGNINVFIKIFSGILFYFCIIFVLKGIEIQEINKFIRILFKK